MDQSICSARARERFALLTQVWSVAHRRAADIRVRTEDNAHLVGLQLHVRIIELVSACRHLIEFGHFASVPILLRTTYEALVEQIALQKDPSYVNRMALSAVREGRGFPDMMSKGDRVLLKAFLAEPGARDFMRVLKAQEERLAKRNAEPISVEDKFAAAGLSIEYPMFRMLSGAVHNDGGELSRHHMERAADGTQFISMFPPPDDEALVMHMDMAAGNLLRSCRVVHGDADPEFGKIWNQIANLIRAENETDGRRLPDLSRYQTDGP